MKKQLLTGLFLSFAYLVSAQTTSLSLVPGQKKSIQSILRLFAKTKPDITLSDNMPVAGNIQTPIFVVNNGKGLNLFESPLDAMIIAEPDSTFHSNMPAGNFQFQKTEPAKK
jgi:hypothetical protein